LNLGWQDEQALYVHRSLLDRLPAVLRAYVGCATSLFGDVAQADVIKIHKASGKVTFLLYDDFEGKSLPVLQHRIKVNLKTRWVQAFDHRADEQLLCFKERFVAEDHPSLEGAAELNPFLQKLGLSPEAAGVGPSRSDFVAMLQRTGLTEEFKRLCKVEAERTHASTNE
jgi:DNA phosphorothioation-associated putative methyltransferase